jgi:flagellar hook-associated protein 3 FlgL
VDFALSKAKGKLERLHLKGASFKNITRPSDDPIGNTEILALRSMKTDSDQYLKNASFAKSQLEYTESALTDLSDLILRAKELAIQQASNLYGPEIRNQVAEEINQLQLQSISIANRRFGNRYIFSGHKALTKAVDNQGHYLGDDGKISVEIAKDYFVPSNINGLEVFFGKISDKDKIFNPIHFDRKTLEKSEEVPLGNHPDRSLASFALDNEEQSQEELKSYEKRTTESERKYPGNGTSNIFQDLSSLHNALKTDNPEIIQDLLEKLDSYLDHVVRMRTKVGAVQNSIESATNQTERDIVSNESYRTKIEDVDVAELASDLQRQQTVLNATYKTSSQLLNRNLMDFLR